MSAWRTQTGGAGDAADSGAALNANDTGADATADGDGGVAAEAEVVAHMSKKRQRMEQLIRKSMGMVLRTFEQETLPTGDQEHTGSATIRSASLSSSRSAGAAPSRDGDSSSEHVAVPAVMRGNNGYVEAPDSEKIRLGKHSWTPDEDTKLCALVAQHGQSQWAQISAHFPNRDRKRCRERFVNHLDPQLKQQRQQDKQQQVEWTAQEEAQLVELQRELGNKWAVIARRLTDRSPEDVKNRFLARAAKQQLVALSQQSESSQATESESARVKLARAPPKRWSKAEANTLRSLVQAHGATNWFFLASHLPGRTDLQCMQQWYQVLDPAVVKGRGTWMPAEDATLLAKVQELGPKWTQISRSLPGRMGKQCRERYLNHLDPSLSKDPWTPEEEAKLTRACEKHAMQWFLIAKELPGRSENATKNHWHTLVRRNLPQATIVGLSDCISNDEKKLECVIEENGENFSVGERQMLCMARALLRKSRIVIFDEAIAAIDHETDKMLQQVIRTAFASSIVLTIAHRLDTVLDSDRIFVLDGGRIVEFESPEVLVKKGSGHFFDLMKEGGYLDKFIQVVT